MIGKLIGALVGRSVAKKRGMSALWGAAAGALAPVILKRGSSMLAHAGKGVMEKRRERKEPVFLDATPARRSGARPTTAGRPRRR